MFELFKTFFGKCPEGSTDRNGIRNDIKGMAALEFADSDHLLNHFLWESASEIIYLKSTPITPSIAKTSKTKFDGFVITDLKLRP